MTGLLQKPADYSPAAGALEGRVVLVTGANRGIGRAIATALVANKATVLAHGRDAKELDRLYRDLSTVGPAPAVAVLDLERAQGNEYLALTDEIDKRYGRLDGLVLNAGMLGDRSPVEHYDIGLWQRVMHVNVNAQFILTRCLLPLLKRSADASIICTTSSVGHRAKPFWGAYCVSKFALEGFAQLLAAEFDGTNLRVNCVNPGATRTRMRAHAYPGEDPDSVTPPEAIVGTYLYLLDPASHGVNGQRFDCQA